MLCNTFTSKDLFKVWIAIINCARSCAMLYITDYPAWKCVYGLRIFICSFGASSEIISDKGLTFENKVVAQFLVVIDIKWTPNLETAPWFFCVCCLNKILAYDTNEELFTNIFDTECTLNINP